MKNGFSIAIENLNYVLTVEFASGNLYKSNLDMDTFSPVTSEATFNGFGIVVVY